MTTLIDLALDSGDEEWFKALVSSPQEVSKREDNEYILSSLLGLVDEIRSDMDADHTELIEATMKFLPLPTQELLDFINLAEVGDKHIGEN